MRANEFTINIPINIKINSDGEPEISTGEEPVDDNVGEFVPPLQKKIELMKKSQGVDSVYDEEGEEQEEAPAEIGTDAGPVDLGFDEDEPFEG